jgi:hypothetical protein
MAAPVVTVAAGFIQDNTARFQIFVGNLTMTNGVYPAETGGIPLDAVLAAALIPTSNSGPKAVKLESTLGTGYIYQYIPSTGKLQILEVPPSGSLTTAAPLQELGSNANSLSEVAKDVIQFFAYYLRNS